MRLAAFIRNNPVPIVKEWESFASTLTPAAENMSPLALRDHIKEILAFIAHDIESEQTDAEQAEKSRGEKPRDAQPSAAEAHASLRHAGGFNMDQMVSEYRSLRASVIKLWSSQLTEVTEKDLHDLIRFNESIDQALIESINDYTKRLDHSRNMFLGILGHDLRSPIATARMSAQLALTIGKAALTENQRMLLSQIVDCADRSSEMINYLLDLTRVRLGSGIPIIRTPMDVGFVAKQLVEEMRINHPDREFVLNISGNTEGEWDKPRIAQIFSNLLNNAVQYGFTDAPISVTVNGLPDEIELSVHNHGLPISPEYVERIFKSLVRGEDMDNQRYVPPGSANLGLGLYITKEIVAAHNGRICVTSSEEEGTTFTVCLPRSVENMIGATENSSDESLRQNV